MRSVVVSDLHLGASSRADLLRRADIRRVLVEALEPGDRLVILGDGLELREVPLRQAAAEAATLLAEAGEALGAEGEIVVLAGNHDHGLVGAWVDARLHQAEPPVLGLEHVIEPADAGPLPRALADAARPARLRLAYPGLHLREDVYAIHGHYADLHTTVPTFERLIAGAMDRWVTPMPDARSTTPDDYEAVVAPIYAWIHTLAQRSQHGVVKAGAGASAKAWVAMTHTNGWAGRARAAALGAGYAAAVGVVNRVGIGPVHRDLSGPALRRGYLRAMHEVVGRLGIEADHVLWGHTHRPGPLAGDDLSEWVAGGTQLWNTGSWVFQPHFIGGPDGTSPYWPGVAAIVEETGPPRLLRLLEGWSRERLRPDPA